ncbi:MAG: hypothetical protein JNL86_07440 [Nitrospira sp.]|nr:hypothetical protein [Nitrospira sp.]MCC7471305.1 hypothetical protein [Candidatus Nomurabacteria bacterium]
MMTGVAQSTTERWSLQVVLVLALLSTGIPAPAVAADGQDDTKSIRKTCGACPEGYATTGRTHAPELCKDGDPVLVQCVPLGSNMLSVCGSCPEGYSEVGRSNVPSRCGSIDGGLVSQCQSQQMGSSLPDPSQGGVRCPPNCGSTAAPGQGAAPPPPKFRPSPEPR